MGSKSPTATVDDASSAFAPLLSARERFLAFLTHRLGNREEAEDILQAALLRATERASQLRDDESMTAWFYRILRNALVDHWRKQARHAERHDAYARESEHPVDPPLETASCECVTSLIGTLKPEYAEAIQRVELEGMSVKAYAEAKRLTANHAGVRLFRARDALRRQVLDCCGGCAREGCHDCDCHEPSPPSDLT